MWRTRNCATRRRPSVNERHTRGKLKALILNKMRLAVGMHLPMRMFRFALPILIGAASLIAGNQEPAANVNSRYTVESVEIVPKDKYRVSESLLDDMRRLVGERFNHELLDTIARRIRRELKARSVSMKVTRGDQADHVKVIYEPSFRRGDSDVVVPRFLYHTKNNFTFGIDAHIRTGGNTISFGALTDNDELIERYSGVRGGFERGGIAGDRLAVKFDLESWRSQWKSATREALAESPEVPGVYRTRFVFRPAIVAKPVSGLSITGGISMQRFETQFPTSRTEASTAAIGSLRLDRQWEPSPGNRHSVAAGYEIRAATNTLDSDYVYTRHFWDASYSFKGRRERVILSGMAGHLNGRAPLFERFVLGNSKTLRGWNRFDIAPIGADRMAHGSADYRYRWFRAVYDVGSVWQRRGKAKVRQSIGIGVGGDEFWALLAFPIREGRAEPMFIVGMNF